MNSLKRRIDRILSEGEGKQLAWLAGIALALFLVLALLGGLWALGWTEVLNLYLDPGGFPLEARKGSQGALNIFSLVISFGGVLVLNALTVSAFSNVFDNISEKYRRGERRYKLRDHVLILGGGQHLVDMLLALRDGSDFDGKDIVVMTSADVETLRGEVETALGDPRFSSRIIWYRGERDNREQLESACAAAASIIYVIGEAGERVHDSASVAALDYLRDICAGEGPALPCYVTLDMHTSLDVLSYLPKDTSSRLQVELLNTNDYLAEQILVGTPFLPVPGAGETLHIVIAGMTSIARSIATVAAQICHFPADPALPRKTAISFVGDNIREEADIFIANHRNLFELSHYSFIVPGTPVEDHAPDKAFGDFLDIEWRFIDSHTSSPFVRDMLLDLAGDPSKKLAILFCYDSDDANISASLHLPVEVYEAGIPVAVYQRSRDEILQKAAICGQFNSVTVFGEALEGTDALFLNRSLRGKRVNYLYALQYNDPKPASEDEAWNGLSHAHKLSSIASAASIPMKLRAFGLDPTRESVASLSPEALESLSEVEHRRWMVSALLMGYRAMPLPGRSDRSRFKELKNEKFIHLDIAPYEELDRHEAGKDTTIVTNIPYILS